MLDIVKDLYHDYEQIKDVELSKLSGIYIKSGKINVWFEKFKNMWTYETPEGKFDYKIDDTATLETLINQLLEAGTIKEGFTVRVYEYVNGETPEFIKLIIPGRRKLAQQEIAGNFELSRLRDINMNLYKDDPEMTEKFLAQMDVVNSDVSQIVRLISSQAHNEETLNLTMRMVSNILAGIPLTDITDDEISKMDWVDFDQVPESQDIKEYFEMEGYEVTKVYLNIRCTRVVKVFYKNLKTNEEEYHYYDTYERIFIDSTTHEPYFGEMSIGEIDMPWTFRPTEEVLMEADEIKENKLVKFNEI